jgi:hypothetical protein
VGVWRSIEYVPSRLTPEVAAQFDGYGAGQAVAHFARRSRVRLDDRHPSSVTTTAAINVAIAP